MSPHLGNKNTCKNIEFWPQPDAEPCFFTAIMARIKPTPCVFTVTMARIKPKPHVFTVISYCVMKKCLKINQNWAWPAGAPKWLFFNDNLIENQ